MILATLSLPHDAVALERAFQDLPGLAVEASVSRPTAGRG